MTNICLYFIIMLAEKWEYINMKLNRLLEITTILLNRKTITASEWQSVLRFLSELSTEMLRFFLPREFRSTLFRVKTAAFP